MAVKGITIYHNKDCARCRKIARVHKALDWRNRVRISTDVPRGLGPLQPGEIAVEDAQTGEMVQGVAAVRRIAAVVPAYLALRPLLWIPPIARKVDRDVRGCADGRCAVVHEDSAARREETG
jgi:hypothetical protein